MSAFALSPQLPANESDSLPVVIQFLEFIGMSDGFEDSVAWPDEVDGPDDDQRNDEQISDQGESNG